MRPGNAESTLAGGCVLGCLDDPLGVLDGVDLWRDDPGRSNVECTLDVQASLAERRTTHGVSPAACIRACIWAVSSGECSASMNNQSNPTSASISTTAGEFSVSSGAIRRSPDLNLVRKDVGI
jgi:hypothetical protein